MSVNNKLVSIIVPLYKGGKYIPSIVEQVRNNQMLLKENYNCKVELIFVNDYPSEIIVNDFSNECFPVKVFNTEKNKGIHGARVFGLNQAKGDWILFLDQDDMILPNYLRSQLDVAQIHESDMVVSNGIIEKMCSESKRKIYKDEQEQDKAIVLESFLSSGNKIISPGQVMINKNKVPDAWKKNIMQNNGADDYFLWILIFKSKIKVNSNYSCVYSHLETGNNTSNDAGQMQKSKEELLNIIVSDALLSSEEVQKLKNTISLHETRKEQKLLSMVKLYDNWMYLKIRKIGLENYFIGRNIRNIVIYGMNYLGNRFYDEIKNDMNTLFAIDRDADKIIADIPVFSYEDKQIDVFTKKIDAIIVCIAIKDEELTRKLKERYTAPVIYIEEIIKGLVIGQKDELI